MEERQNTGLDSPQKLNKPILESEAGLNFANLWDKGESVRRHSTDRRRILEEFSNIMNERVTAEMEYSKSLSRIGTHLKRLISTKGDIGEMIALFSSDLDKRAQMSMNFADNIRNSVIELLRNTHMQQEQQSKPLHSETKRLEKELQSNLDNLEKTRLKYVKSKRELDEMQMQNYIYKITSHMLQEKREKHNQKMMQSFQRLELERNQIFHVVFKKLMDLETHQGKIVQENINQQCQHLEEKDQTLDMINFIKQEKSSKPYYETILYEQYVSFIDCSMDRIRQLESQGSAGIESQQERQSSQQLRQNPLLDEYNEYDDSEKEMVRHTIENPDIILANVEGGNLASSSKSILSQVLSITVKAWNNLPITPVEFKHFYDMAIEDPKYFKDFTFVLQQFRIGNKFVISTNTGYHSMAILLVYALNGCFKFRDSKYSRQLLGLSFTYYFVQDLSNGSMIESIENPGQIQKVDSKESFGSEGQSSVEEGSIDSDSLKQTTIEDFSRQSSGSSIPSPPMSMLVQNMSNKESSEILPDKQSSKVYLHQSIETHHLWKSRDFWEAAIFDSVQEELASSVVLRKDETMKESIQRERFSCLGQVMSLVQNMLLFRIDKRDIKYLLQKFVKLFSLSEEQVKHINSIVDSNIY